MTEFPLSFKYWTINFLFDQGHYTLCLITFHTFSDWGNSTLEQSKQKNLHWNLTELVIVIISAPLLFKLLLSGKYISRTFFCPFFIFSHPDAHLNWNELLMTYLTIKPWHYTFYLWMSKTYLRPLKGVCPKNPFNRSLLSGWVLITQETQPNRSSLWV